MGCRRGIQIRRDQHGVAYVDAQDELDAWFGLGFCHGQDRAGQLEVTLRLTRGALSEVLGPAGLGIDRASRLIGVHRAAKAQLPTLDPDMRDQVAAYCAGVNAARSFLSWGIANSSYNLYKRLPVFAPPPGKSDVEHLRDVACEGLRWRYGDNPEQKFVAPKLRAFIDASVRVFKTVLAS